MAEFAEALRHFWLRGIHQVNGVTRETLGDWLAHRNFVFTSITGRDDFTIRVLTPEGAKRGFAHDSTRMASAAFETMLGIQTATGLPKATAWIVIRAYYAAFYAAHSLLRMFGTACMQLQSEHTNALDSLAQAFGVLPTAGFESGFYIALYDSRSDEIHFRKTLAARRGSHEILWEAFADKARYASNHLLTVSSAFRTVALQLDEIESVLRQHGHNAGNWLSHVRNLATYKHELGLWFPYANSKISASELATIVRRWKSRPSHFFPNAQKNDIATHVWLCTLIVAICYEVATDIESHGTRRKCFHTYGGLALTRLAPNLR